MRPTRLIPLIVVIFAALVILPNVIAAAQGFQLTMKNKLNVRSGPGTKYTILGTLAKGDVVDAVGRSPDSKWYVILYPPGMGWIINSKANFSSVGGNIKSLPEMLIPPLPASGSSSGNAVAPSGPTCSNIRATCSQLRSCDEAKACLAAGNGKLDRDNDGIPCESLCGG